MDDEKRKHRRAITSLGASKSIELEPASRDEDLKTHSG